ncbi:M56 family metallopeptidase [Membranihabitans maritimus]|uniref:M56 family metallopeptidase n=1 Tax=Membranihabitans maritimus TaxID=2904244 RepID=UPI001F2AB415|nr:M56 family metallopeptidase [Membranihabitans maritimus]
MIVYISKYILCSLILIVFYFLVLEREKTFIFNRYFLLFSIVFSLVLPLLPVHHINSSHLPESIPLIYKSLETSFSGVDNPINQSGKHSMRMGLVIIYLVVAGFLIIRFTMNLHQIFYLINKSRIIKYKQVHLVLVSDQQLVYSFMNYIFLPEKDYKNGDINKQVIHHEMAHISQKHTWDVVALEFLICFLWFNPLLLLYRKALTTNHEYLADDSVVRITGDQYSYQYLLIQKASAVRSNLVHSFNYLRIKKRLKMITKNSSTWMGMLNNTLSIPLFLLLFMLFCYTPKALYSESLSYFPDEIKYVFLVDGNEQDDLVTQFNSIIKKYEEPGDWWRKVLHNNISKEDEKSLLELFLQMNEEQKDQIHFGFLKISVPHAKIPSIKQFEEWKNTDKYGIWLNGNWIPNDRLNNYKAKDIQYYTVSYLHNNARHGINEHKEYQVDLSTKSEFEKQRNKFENKPKYLLAAKTIKNQ